MQLSGIVLLLFVYNFNTVRSNKMVVNSTYTRSTRVNIFFFQNFNLRVDLWWVFIFSFFYIDDHSELNHISVQIIDVTNIRQSTVREGYLIRKLIAILLWDWATCFCNCFYNDIVIYSYISYLRTLSAALFFHENYMYLSFKNLIEWARDCFLKPGRICLPLIRFRIKLIRCCCSNHWNTRIRYHFRKTQDDLWIRRLFRVSNLKFLNVS